MNISIISAGMLVLCMWAGWAPCTQAKHNMKNQKYLRANDPVLDNHAPVLEPRFVAVTRRLSDILKDKINTAAGEAMPVEKIVEFLAFQVDLTAVDILEIKCGAGTGMEHCVFLNYHPGAGAGAAKMRVGVKGLTVRTKVSYDGHSLGKDDPTVVLEGVFFAVSLEIDPKNLDLSVKGHVYSHKKARVLPGYNSGWGKANGKILEFLGEDGASDKLTDMIKDNFGKNIEKMVAAFVAKRSDLLSNLGFEGPVKQGQTLLDAVKEALAKHPFKLKIPVDVFDVRIFTVKHVTITDLQFTPNHMRIKVLDGDISFSLRDLKVTATVTGKRGETTVIQQGAITASATAAIPKLEVKLKWTSRPNIQLTYKSSSLVTQISHPKVHFESDAEVNKDIDKALADPFQSKINEKVADAIKDHLDTVNKQLAAL